MTSLKTRFTKNEAKTAVEKLTQTILGTERHVQHTVYPPQSTAYPPSQEVVFPTVKVLGVQNGQPCGQPGGYDVSPSISIRVGYRQVVHVSGTIPHPVFEKMDGKYQAIQFWGDGTGMFGTKNFELEIKFPEDLEQAEEVILALLTLL